MLRLVLIGALIVSLSALLAYRLIINPRKPSGVTPATPKIQDLIKTDNLFKTNNPGLSEAEKIKSLQSQLSTLLDKISQLEKTATKSATPLVKNGSTEGQKIRDLETTITQLQAKVTTLEQQTNRTSQPSSGSTPVVYIPLGSGGSTDDKNWFGLDGYEVSLNPADYPGYSNMYLEVTLRLVEKVGTAYARLYSISDNKAVSSELSSTSEKNTLLSSSGFKLPDGSKTYRLQVKSSEGYQVLLQNSRIKVTF